MDMNKVLGALLLLVGLFDMLVLPRLVPTLPPAAKSLIQGTGVLFAAGGLALLLGLVRLLA